MVRPTWSLFLQRIVRSRGTRQAFSSSKYQDLQCVDSSMLGLSTAQALSYIACPPQCLYNLLLTFNTVKAALQPATSVVCPDTSAIAGACSLYGICLAVATSAANTAPTISLITTAPAPATTTIKLGYTYMACASGQQPSAGAECELGATAQDGQNGNLTASVLVCAPAACTGLRCISSKAPILALHNAGLAGSVGGTAKLNSRGQ